MPDIIALGELLVDMVATEVGSIESAPGFLKAAGGAPANVAAGAARLGVPSGFVGAVGNDPFGRFLAGALQAAGVDTSQVQVVERPTALAFVSQGPQGERDFMFYGERPAHLHLDRDRLDPAYIQGARILHYGSICLADEPARTATLAALRMARAAGALCSYDPNLRPGLWPTHQRMIAGAWEGMGPADLLKVSAEELAELAGGTSAHAARQLVRDASLALAVVTLGAEGCFFVGPEVEGRVPPHAVNVVDTTGAGDAFVAALLVQLAQAGATTAAALREASVDRVSAWLAFANRAGALACRRKGAIPALPTRAEVEAGG